MKKMEKKPNQSLLKNERGIITLDFVFAIVIAFGFSSIFFALAITLSMVEATQYIAFASARSYLAAHETKSLQKQTGENKFREIMAYPAFRALLNPSWFQVSPPTIGSFNEEYRDYQPTTEDSETFEGARVPIIAHLLNLKVPFLGPTVTESSTGKANISSYMGREVSTEECRVNFNAKRFQFLRAVNFGGGTPYNNGATNSVDAALITDNGC